MEERTIKINIEKAREWYNSNLPSLKEVALQAFTEEELRKPNIKYIVKHLLEESIRYKLSNIQILQLKAVQKDIINTSAPKLLRILAVYFNMGLWKKTGGKEGYFFYKKEGVYNTNSKQIIEENWVITYHTFVTYPTLVYFKNEQDCRWAFNILKSLGKLDALYIDF